MPQLDERSAMHMQRSDQRMILSNLLGVAIVLAFWLVITLECIYLGGISFRTILISADAAVLLTPLILRFIRDTFDLFEPIVIAISALMAMMVFRPMSDIITGHYHEHAYDIGPTYDAALLLVLAANFAFILGYETSFGKRLVSGFANASTSIDVRTATIWAGMISVTGCLVFSIFLFSNGGLGFFLTLSHGRAETTGNPYAQTSAYIYNAVGLLVPGASIFFALWLYRRKFIFLVLSGVVLFPYLFLVLGGGARSGVVGVLFGFPLMWYAYRDKRPGGAVLIVGGLAVAVLFSTIRDSRVEVGSAKGSAAQAALSDPVTTVLNLFSSDDDEMFDVIAQEIAVIPEWVPYNHGSVIRDIFIRAIPRGFFPNGAKPKEAATNFFATMEPGRARVSGAGTASSIIGNFYLDSGAVTSILYMFLMGILLSAIWSYYRANKESLILLIAFSIVPASVLNTSRGDLPNFLGSLPYGLLPVLLLFSLQRLRLSGTRSSTASSRSIAGPAGT